MSKMQTKLKTPQQEEYKETELGLLPKEWKVVNFEKCIIKKKVGITKIKQQQYKKFGEYPIVDQGQKLIAGYWNNKKDLYQDELPVIIFGDHTRIIKFVDFPFVAGADGTKIIIPDKSKTYPLFFYYALLTLNIPSRGYNRHYSLLKEKKIPLPPLQEQKAIAFVLSTIQTAKEKTEQVIQATKELKKSLMKHLFTYGPVSLKDAEKVKLKETEIGKIPEGWKVVKVKDVFDIFAGGDISKLNGSLFKTGNFIYPIYSISLENNGLYGFADTYKFPEQSITITGRGNLGYAIPRYEKFNAIIRLLVLVPKINIDIKFIAEFINGYIKVNFEGSSIPQLTRPKIATYFIPLPPLQTQKKIASILSAVDEKIEKEENKKKALEELFKSMLHNLMTAKIRVKDLGVEND